jgi:hypothetical protein
MRAVWGVRLAGVYSIGVSLGLLVSLWLRAEASVNWLNVFTLVLASLSGYTAVRYTKQGWGLVPAYLLLLFAVAPTTFGWIVFLYLPLVAILTLALLWIMVTWIAGSLKGLVSSRKYC